jgi:hypothetical protein
MKVCSIVGTGHMGANVVQVPPGENWLVVTFGSGRRPIPDGRSRSREKRPDRGMKGAQLAGIADGCVMAGRAGRSPALRRSSSRWLTPRMLMVREWHGRR